MDQKINRVIGRLEGKVDSLIVDIKYIRETTDKELKDLDDRVSKLEKRQFTIVIIATALWTGLLAWFKKIF